MTNEHGYSQQKDNYAKRLRRIEGQVRGIARMIEEDKYCIDVLTQISAVNSALRSVALNLLDEHLGHCVTRAVAGGGDDADEKLAEASAAIARLVRSLIARACCPAKMDEPATGMRTVGERDLVCGIA